jgi:hypothetical protein
MLSASAQMKCVLLLIEPVWNWNIETSKVSVIKPDQAWLLIEPVWNWNLESIRSLQRTIATFNRTSMELKQRCSAEIDLDWFLLIEPVWNWNLWYASSPPAHSDVIGIGTDEMCATFNRTSMELKLMVRIITTSPFPTFNRTSMLLWFLLKLRHDLLLIEPVWNWNFIRGTTVYFKFNAFNRTSMAKVSVIKPDQA